MRQKIQLKGQLGLYIQWPWIVGIFLAILTVIVCQMDLRAGWLVGGFFFLYLCACGWLYFYQRKKILPELLEFAASYEIVQNSLLRELLIPYALLAEDGSLLWCNDHFGKILGKNKQYGSLISHHMRELKCECFPGDLNETIQIELCYGQREYVAHLQRISVENFTRVESLLKFPQDRQHFIALQLQDVTNLHEMIRKNEAQRLVAGLIYIDNYDEAMDSMEEIRQSLLVALIDRKVYQYVTNHDGIVKKLEKDKYFIAVRKRRFLEMEQNKFSILGEVKRIRVGNEIAMTLSMGFGLSKDTYAKSYEFARSAINLALTRGGDQAVVKNGIKTTYHGGKTEQIVKNVRVKARVKAEALREAILMNEQVLVMGHQLADADSFGAAIGIYRVVKTLGKTVHVVLNEMALGVKPFYRDFMENEVYPEDLFIDSQEALELAMRNCTLVVVVDTNQGELTECPQLLKQNNTVVVLDHHRQKDEGSLEANLSYIETYASSACEMVTEIIQYIDEEVKLTRLEANALYAGVVIDTNNFQNRTGVRTFEAVAFLRRQGADITYVRKSLRNDIKSCQARAQIISGAELYRKRFAIASGVSETIESPTILGAQAANELLNMDGIQASFVLTLYRGRIYVSARSIDEMNVQLVMEQLGGGGHINAAGAQFDHSNMEEAIASLKETLDAMLKGGNL